MFSKILPILVSIFSSFTPFILIIFRYNLRLQLYNTNFTLLTYVHDIFVSSNFLEYTPKEFPQQPVNLVNSLFNNFITSNFLLSFFIFTECSVSFGSVSFSFFICTNSALQFLFIIYVNNILIVSNIQSYFFTKSSKSFSTVFTFLVLLNLWSFNSSLSIKVSNFVGT